MSSEDMLGMLPAVGARLSLVDVAYFAVREAITSGALGPGMPLREAALARHFSVSTTPVREALRRLDREGLVRHAPHRGAVVADFNLREILDHFEVREALECHAARRAANQPMRDLSAAQAVLAAARDLATNPFERLEWNRLEVSFHRAVNDVSGNDQLAEMAERIHRTVQALCVRCLSTPIYGPETLQLMLSHHRDILDAVAAGDADAAEACARAHIRYIRDSVAEVLSARVEGDA
jgi:DNA-binding GntR family transcriptional regulator